MRLLEVALTAALAAPIHPIRGIDVDGWPSSPSVRIKVEEHRSSARKPRQSKSDAGTDDFVCDHLTPHHRGLFCENFILPGRGNVPAGTVFTPGMARSAVREIPMPGLELHVQPEGPTLVNVDTIFYADAATVTASIELLGHTIRIEATPTQFTWIHGDGTSQTTSSPGAPYPSRDITHRYMRPADGLDARVDTTYSVRFSIDGDGWDDLGEDLTATGPSTPIAVDEASPVLVKD